MENTTPCKHMAVKSALLSFSEMRLPPAQGFFFNRLSPYLDAAWESASTQDWPAFVEAVRDIYLAGLLDSPLPLGVLLAEALAQSPLETPEEAP
ncbi:hypothetical protein [Meiothermus taiwanensis]|uniref:hypothetical protein n=1 Tax=Meiothermus taiwanensis TaxID=172827 RepID=UPI0012DC7930|nr:MAG: hypothetical protein KatS3mg071_2583 [Meiothermus sp.]